MIAHKLKRFFDESMNLYGTVSNWHDYLRIKYLKALPAPAITLRIKNRNWMKELRIGDRKIEFDYKGKKVTLAYDTLPDLQEAVRTTLDLFANRHFQEIGVIGENVVDLGASIGDSAIFFVLEGAKHVYAYEPFPYSYETAKKNILMNRLGKKISLFNIGCGRKCSIRIPAGFESGPGTELVERPRTGRGRNVKMMPIKEIMWRSRLKEAVLKVECEGAEYEIFDNTDVATLCKFKRIFVGYHYGMQNLARKVKASGFDSTSLGGELYATRNGRLRVMGHLLFTRHSITS